MPTYQYACTACAAPLEVVQAFVDDPLTECPTCGGRLRKVFSPVGVVFKGSGFYKTDSRAAAKKASAAASSSSGKDGSASSGSDGTRSADREQSKPATSGDKSAPSTTPSTTSAPTSSTSSTSSAAPAKSA